MELFDILKFTSSEVENVDITTTHPDWTDLLQLQGEFDAGKYAVIGAIQFQVGSVRQSFIYQYSMDGGVTWLHEYYKEVKDKQNVEVTEVLNVIDHPGGDIDFRCRVTRESDFDCTVLKALLTIERKS
jgi:hypothetical protein